MEFARVIWGVSEGASTIRDYRGRYLRIDPLEAVDPGDIVLVGTQSKWIKLYIAMPPIGDNYSGGLMHIDGQQDVRQQQGWHRLLRHYCRGWLALTRRERIYRYAMMCRNQLHAELDRGVSEIDARNFRQAVEYYSLVMQHCAFEPSEAAESIVLSMLQAMVQDLQEFIGDVTADGVAAGLRQALRLNQHGPNVLPDASLRDRLMAIHSTMNAMDVDHRTLQRFFDIAGRNGDMDAAAEEVERRVSTPNAQNRRRTRAATPAARIVGEATTPPEAPVNNTLRDQQARNIRIRRRD